MKIEKESIAEETNLRISKGGKKLDAL